MNNTIADTIGLSTPVGTKFSTRLLVAGLNPPEHFCPLKNTSLLLNLIGKYRFRACSRAPAIASTSTFSLRTHSPRVILNTRFFES